jgi:hypothetical protein
MTILVWFHSSGYRDFKTFYTQHVVKYLLGAFHGLVSYSGFVELQREASESCHALSFLSLTSQGIEGGAMR